VVERSGWVVYAWVLMGNHYHFVFQTPEPNLVAGMKWFQNTWTRRFNVCHRLWGHLFGGRYKAILVEESDYLTRLIHYVHLNPVRAGLVKRSEGLESYPWCSLSDSMSARRGKGYGGEQTRDHGIAEAERIIAQAGRDLKIAPDDWGGMRKGDWRKGLVAGIIRRRALVDNGWLAQRLHMGARNAVSRTIKMAEQRIATDREARRVAKRVENNVK
jgi:hypothetical protein